MLSLSVEKRGQAHIDFSAITQTFWLQYIAGLNWTDTACRLLRRVAGLTYDKHLFLHTYED